jgi:hypothetical protein
MKSHARVWLVALIAGAAVALSAPAAQASFGIESFFASNCNATHEGCKKAPPAEEVQKAHEEGFTQAGGHPPFGITDFTVNNTGGVPSGGPVTHIRTDVAPGVSTNPVAVPKCSVKEFGTEVAKGVFTPPGPECTAPLKSALIGRNNATVFAGAPVPLEGSVYNLVPTEGLSSLFGVALSLAPLGHPGVFAHTLIEGHVEWASDYHDYFEIKVNPELPLVSSRLTFFGNIGTGTAPFGSGGFITNPTSCTGPGPQTTSTLTLESENAAKEVTKDVKTYKAPIGSENCGAVPFAPEFKVEPATTQSDEPDGITTTLRVPHDLSPAGIDSSQLKTATVTMPEGMTLNPSAAADLAACKPSQARINSLTPGVACPAKSKIGTVELEVPGLPAKSLTGNLYLGGPENGPITGQPYTMYIDAESPEYGISVRIKGSATGNESTGRVTAQFTENPEQPFSNLVIHFKGGALAPIANPLNCGTATTNTAFVPFSGTLTQEPFSSFAVDSNGSGGGCASPLPLAPTQSTLNSSGNAGARTNFTFSLTRPSGQQYLSQVKTTLPPGLVGQIPTIKQCPEAQANAGTCGSESELGPVSAVAGAGPTPFTFNGGHAYLTGPYKGAPFGMSIVVPAVAGPFSLGNVVTRATINVDPHNSQVTVTAVLPRVFQGVALRLRGFVVSVNRQNFLLNPTNCAPLATESSVTGFIPGSSASSTANLSTPFQVANCDKLAFKPAFKAASGAKTSKANGASLETTLNMAAGQSNIRSVLVQLPKQLPSRLTTLQKACPEAVFAANPFNCPSGSFVGGVRANTPVLPSKLKGPAILVSHAAAAFPDLDLVLDGDGVRTILVGNTNIKKGITTTNFATTPDVPVSSITVNLPTGPHSALAAFGNLCASPLLMPTTITGWNGKQVKQKTKIAVGGCPVRIVGHKVVRNTVFLTVQTPAAGRISGSGSGLATAFRRLNKATNATTLKVSLSRAGRQRHRPFTVRLRVGFVPKKKGPHSTATVTVRFR